MLGWHNGGVSVVCLSVCGCCHVFCDSFASKNLAFIHRYDMYMYYMNTDLLLESVLKVKHIEIQAGIWHVKSETDQTHLMHCFETIWPVEKVENWGGYIVSTKKNYKRYEIFLGKVKYWFACMLNECKTLKV